MKLETKILILDDHPILAEGVKNIIETNYKGVSTYVFINPEEAISKLNIINPNIIISDISMPNMSGIEFSKIVKHKLPKAKIIILSQFTELQIIKPLLTINVDAIILKGQDTSEIKTAIDTVMLNKQYYTNEIKEIIFNSLKNKNNNDVLIKLTKREKQVLELIADQKTSKEISELLFLSIPTIETYRSNLFRKLEVKNTAGLIRKAIHLGFID